MRGNVRGSERQGERQREGRVKDRVRDSVRDGVKDRVRGNVKDSKHKVRDGEGKNGAGESGKRFDGNEAHFPGSAVEKKRRGWQLTKGTQKGRKDFQSLKTKWRALNAERRREDSKRGEAHIGDGEADGATVSARC